MNIFPAIDLYEGKAVRLYRGDYAQMTVYSEDPISVVKDFVRAGARFIHVVDLEARALAARRICRSSGASVRRRIYFWKLAAAFAIWKRQKPIFQRARRA